MAERIAILGASGLLGSRLDLVHRPGQCLRTCFSRPAGSLVPLDLTHKAAVVGLIKDFGPSLVYLPAAVTTPALCQSDPDLARAVNTEPAALLSDLALEMGFRLVFISSDLVFDGLQGDYRESDLTDPLSVYGRTKVEAEQAVVKRIDRGADCLVIRTSLIIGLDRFGPTGNLAWMEGLIRFGKKIPLFVDEFRNPVAALELARGLRVLAERAGPGLYHLAGPEKMSRYDLGRIICEAEGWPESCLNPTCLADLDLNPPRPADVSLNQDKAKAILGEQAVRSLAQTLRDSLTPHPG